MPYEAADEAVITSGAYERYFEKDGKTYHHIIDPATGKPSKKDLKSVTIISKNGTLSDTLSTTLFVMGKDKAISYWKEHSKEFNMILVEKIIRYIFHRESKIILVQIVILQ